MRVLWFDKGEPGLMLSVKTFSLFYPTFSPIIRTNCAATGFIRHFIKTAALSGQLVEAKKGIPFIFIPACTKPCYRLKPYSSLP
jgi:hypothetical protein